MNYELLSKLALEETDKYKNEISLLRKRNEILRNEVDNLKDMIIKLQEDKKTLEDEVTSLKGALKFKEEVVKGKTRKQYDSGNYLVLKDFNTALKMINYQHFITFICHDCWLI